jgi:tocopherol cyclase
VLKKIRKTLDPPGYHGDGVHPPFFEGWYIKCINRNRANAIVVIPGIQLHTDKTKSQAFIQVLDGNARTTRYVSYPLETFSAARRGMDFRIDKNIFSARRLLLDIDSPDCRLQGELEFSGLSPWPVSFRSPGIMGWYAWAPFMECYHGVVSLDHAVSGCLTLDGRKIHFDGGRGYIEKDWGRSFPRAYTWMQCNHFHQTRTGLIVSIAVIPWLRGSCFRGFIIGFLQDGYLHKFATYTGAKLRDLSIDDREIRFIVSDMHHRLVVTAQRAAGGWLQAPGAEGMGARVAETLNGVIDLEFSEKEGSGWKPLFRGQGAHAGVEAAGDLPLLLRMSSERSAEKR